MKADLSRGFNPDRKRNKDYRRVLLQQGRMLLDSDVAALVDANDRLHRQHSMDLGSAAGGHERGYMVTAGRLYATFRELAHVVDPPAGVTPLARHVDYTVRFRRRFPSLRLDTEVAGGGSVRINLFAPHPRGLNIVLWLRRDPAQAAPAAAGFLSDELGAALPLAGGSFSDLSDTVFRRFEFSVPAGPNPVTALIIHFDNAVLRRLFVAMIESAQTAIEDSFWIHRGRFHVQGLMLENAADIPYPDQVAPAPTAGLSLAGQRAVAYLEGWERVLTALHDPGIRERALSTNLDTSVRTQPVGQVKTFLVPATTSAQAIRSAFSARSLPTGQLNLTTVTTGPSANPCGVTLEGGFTGRENHLYHFEVHAFNPGANSVRIKWSREAGSELFGADSFEVIPGAQPEFNVFVKPELGLREGDIVEVLNEIIELGDDTAAPASVAGGRFIPPRRLVGALAVLKAVSSGLGLDKFALRNFDAPAANIQPSAALYPTTQRLYLRRWHAIIDGSLPSPAVDIESGFQLSIQGTFEVGDFWQFEARLTPNDGSVSLTRHGPERLFSPLALLGPDGAASRPEVIEWLDEPFVAASRVSADTIHFDDSAARFVEFVEGDTNTLQAIIDHLLTKGVGRRIVDRITRVFNNGGIISGNWQLSVGDGTPGLSFGDFNGADAIQQTVAFARALVGTTGGVQNPWSLRLLVKRGTYQINDGSRIVLVPGEALFLEGESSHNSAAALRAASLIQCDTTVNPAFDAVGSGSRIQFENLNLVGGVATPTFGALVGRTAGEIRIRRCRLQNRSIVLRGGADSAPPQYALTLADSTLEATFAAPMLRIEFPETGNGTCPPALIERCRISVPVNVGFATVGSAPNEVRLEGLVVRSSSVSLAGSNSAISAAFNPGLVSLQVSAFPDAMLSIGELLFEDCRIDAGAAATNGVLLHLTSGNDIALDRRVRSIDHVAIRGGRWAVRTDAPSAAGPGAFYVGDRVFALSGADPRIRRLTVENVQIGWESVSASLRYVSSVNAAHALVMSANEVNIRNLTVFGMVTSSTLGELSVLGAARASIDGILMTGFRSGGGGSVPQSRILIASAGSGVVAANVEVATAFNTATTGLVLIAPAGTPTPAQRTLFSNCRLAGNRGGTGAGFAKAGNTLSVELVNCAAVQCTNGVSFSQNATTEIPSRVVINGGTYSQNDSAGVVLSVGSNLVAIVVDGITATQNSVIGLQINRSATFTATTWERRGPTVVNNRVFSNGSGVGAQILLGDADIDEIGGLCINNYCGANPNGQLRVDVLTTYAMRGLAVESIAPWAVRPRVQTPTATDPPGAREMTLNVALWARN